MLEFINHGHRVICARDDLGLRIWHCDCLDFERRLLKYGEGFCQHVALAIQRAIEDGHIVPIVR